MQTIKQFLLRDNMGGDCAGKIQYLDDDGNVQVSSGAKTILLGQQEWVNPADLGVPDNSVIMLYIDVVAGGSRTGGTYFMGSSSSNQYAEYDITGTVDFSKVHFDGVKSQ